MRRVKNRPGVSAAGAVRGSAGLLGGFGGAGVGGGVVRLAVLLAGRAGSAAEPQEDRKVTVRF